MCNMLVIANTEHASWLYEAYFCRGPTARFLKNRELSRNSESRELNNY